MLGDLVVWIHFAWILFMVGGFLVNCFGFVWKKLFEMWIFRSVHLLGIVFVAFLILAGKSCPLTRWEQNLRVNYYNSGAYENSFLVHYIEKFVYPDVQPALIAGCTFLIAGITVLIFILRPPGKLKRFFRLMR